MSTRKPKPPMNPDAGFKIHKAIFNLNMPSTTGVLPHKNWWMGRTRSNALSLLEKMDKTSLVGEKWQNTNYEWLCKALNVLAGKKKDDYGTKIDTKWAGEEVHEGDLSVLVFNVLGRMIYYGKNKKCFASIDKKFNWHSEYDSIDHCFGNGFYDDFPRAQEVQFFINPKGLAYNPHPKPVEYNSETAEAFAREGMTIVNQGHTALAVHEYIINDKIEDDDVLSHKQWTAYKEYLDSKQQSSSRETIVWYDLCLTDKHASSCSYKEAMLPREWKKHSADQFFNDQGYTENITGYRNDGEVVRIWTTEYVNSCILMKQPEKKEFAIIWGGDEIEGGGKTPPTSMFTNGDLLRVLHNSKTMMFIIVCANNCGEFGSGAENLEGGDYLVFNACREGQQAWHDTKYGDYFMRYLRDFYLIDQNPAMGYKYFFAHVQYAMQGINKGTAYKLASGFRPNYMQDPVMLGYTYTKQNRLWYFMWHTVPYEGKVREIDVVLPNADPTSPADANDTGGN